MALHVVLEDLEKVVPHAHLVVSRRAPPSISLPEVGHSHGHASVTPEDAALGIGEQVSGVGTAYTTSGFVAPKGDSEAAIKDLMVGAG